MNPSSSWEDKVKSEWKARAKTWDMKSASMEDEDYEGWLENFNK